MSATELYKATLGLKPLSSRFYDFLVHFFQFKDNVTEEFIKRQLAPWFFTADETKKHEHYSQYYVEWVHQKYRLALEFCAVEAGFDNVVLYDGETLAPVSSGYFWFRDCHPQDVHWHMSEKDTIIARGSEPPNSLTFHTMEDWLLTHMAKFAETKRTSHVGTSSNQPA